MRLLQQNLAILADNAANLLIQISELNDLRQQLRKAQLSARRSQQLDSRKRTRPRGKYIAKNADPHKHEAELCETCGGWIDCRDLGSVFDHQGPHDLPPEDRKH
jgi:hypothetical protein